MKPEAISEVLAPVQENINAQRQYDTELRSLEEPLSGLEERLATTRAQLTEIVQDLCPDMGLYRHWRGVPKIVLQRVITLPDDPKPTGELEVKIVPMEFGRRSGAGSGRWEHSHKLGPAHENDFKLLFTFRATDLPHGEVEEIGVETTYEEDTSDLLRLLHYRSRGLHEPARKYTGAEENLLMRRYKTHYLPERTEEIADLEKSVAWIKEALNNPDLNPWYQELLQDRQRAKELRQKELEESRARDAEAAASEVAVSSSGLKRIFKHLGRKEN